MQTEYNFEDKEKLKKIYKALPEELKKALFSEEINKIIYDICEKNEVLAEKIPLISEYVGYALLKVLPAEEFQKALKIIIGLDAGAAKKITDEISRLIFSPLAPYLTGSNETKYDDLEEHKIKISRKHSVNAEKEVGKRPKEEIGHDTYREPIE